MPAQKALPVRVGRYVLHHEIASGGMATVHFGVLSGPGGFSRAFAIKRLHPQFAKDPEFVAMFLDEARLAGRIHHPNVVSTIDVVSEGDELFLVLEYVPGESLSRLARASRENTSKIPVSISAAVITGALDGLHAAHEAKDDRGESLDIVHRDVSPQNVLVGTDGVARVLDFGVAKAIGRAQMTREGHVKGKLAYMAPEQLRRGMVDRRADIYAAGVVLWEALAGARLFTANDEGAIVASILEGDVAPPSERNPDVPSALDDVVLRALSRDPAQRFGTAELMARAVEEAAGDVASANQVGEWVRTVASDALEGRRRLLAEIELHEGAATKLTPLEFPRSSEPPSQSPNHAALSQVSSISVSTPGNATDASSRRRSRRSTLYAFAAGLCVAGALFAGARLLDRPAPAISGTASGPPESSGAPSSEATPPAREDSTPLVTSSTLPAPSATPPSSPPSRATSAPRAWQRSAPPIASARCGVRTWVDNAGVKHYADTCAKMN